MLSRVAERTYWAGRYLERAENTARLISVCASLLLDLPEEAGLKWRLLVEVVGSEGLFDELYDTADEADVLRFILADAGNPGSLLASLSAARENLRTTRDIVPKEGWECVNELYLFAKENMHRAAHRRRRYDILARCTARCQQITGLLDGTMSHGDAYNFMRIGRHLERADMNTRVVDVAAATFLSVSEPPDTYENTIWMGVLKSLSAYQMYRQNVRRRVRAPDVLHYLLKDALFPRSMHHCLAMLEESLSTLPRSDAPMRSVQALEQEIREAAIADLIGPRLHAQIDQWQIELARIHDSIQATWFLPDTAS